MKTYFKSKSYVISLWIGLGSTVFAAAMEPAWSLVQKEKPALLDTLKELVEIESGSSDLEGLNKIADVIAAKFKQLGATVDFVEPAADAYRDSNTPEKLGRMVRATFTGTGNKKILLLAHMDTVYRRGMLAGQPFKIDGDRAYGLAISDDKHGVALILHALTVLNAMKFRDYGTVTVLITADGEIGKKLTVSDTPRGGGTDAAYAALKTKAPVVEGFGLQGFGAHSTNAEYVLISSIEPRLYLATRMIMAISTGKAALK